ncbi:MAG: tandem-95 repeat protein, partial [bacterium]
MTSRLLLTTLLTIAFSSIQISATVALEASATKNGNAATLNRLRSTATLNPTDDAYTRASRATRNYGTSSFLRLKNSAYHIYLKFNVAGLSGIVQDAKLRLYLYDGGNQGGMVYSVSNNYNDGSGPWSENGITWNNAPVISGAWLDSLGTVSAKSYIEFDVTAAVTGNGIFSFGIDTPNGSSNYHRSKEYGSNPPELVITLAPVGNPPVAADDPVTATEDTQTAINVLGNDSDSDGTLVPSSVTIISQPSNGTITNIDAATGDITYSPNADYFGGDSFTYTVQDNDGNSSNAATVTVTVNNVNDNPVAANDVDSTQQNAPVTVDILNNDSDVDGSLDASTVTIISPPTNGAITNIDPATGQVTYSPVSSYIGSDSFTYTVNDNDGAASNTAT